MAVAVDGLGRRLRFILTGGQASDASYLAADRRLYPRPCHCRQSLGRTRYP